MAHKFLSQQLVVRPVQHTVSWLKHASLNRETLRTFWRDHGIALVVYAVLSIALSWPMLRHFTTHIIGGGPDALHNLWVFWHTQQAVLGNQPWFFTPLLYYPQGASLLTHGLGPVTGIFSLPFWPWGPEAAHNGAVLISLWLTGYCMYLLARGLQFDRDIALFAGMMLMTAPMCLAGLLGNITKVFLGGLALVLLAVHHAINPQRSAWWTLTVAITLLIPLLHSGYQFMFAALGVAFFLAVGWMTAKGAARWAIFKRGILIGLSTAVIIGPFIFAILTAASSEETAVKVDLSTQSGFQRHQPDLIQFLLPDSRSWFFGSTSQQIAAQFDVTPTIDKAVSLSWTGILLCCIALWQKRPWSRRWLLFTLVCVVLAMGPFLRAFGRTVFTEYNLEIILPYAFLTGLPGFDFMRFPGRFMMIGYVGFGIAASFGLAWLVRHFPHRRTFLILGAAVLILIETWPKPVYVTQLPAAPPFYRHIAHDDELYGVFDLPVSPIPDVSSYVIPSSIYMVHQITHQKGIAAGYLSRTYDEHPLFPYLMNDDLDLGQKNLYVNDTPAGRVLAHDDLARNNYRYVVWHKHLRGAEGEKVEPARAYLTELFGEQAPLVDDEFTQVYAIPQTRAPALLESGRNWRRSEGAWRWAASPATLEVTSLVERPALLEITPAALHDPESANGLGQSGVLDIEIGATFATSAPLTVDQPTVVPVVMPAGSHAITLTLQAGNFQPRDYGGDDTATLSFAMRSINLLTAENPQLTADILIDGQPQQEGRSALVAYRGAGWHDPAPGAARWAVSPAELFVYSPTARTVRLALTPAVLYDPARPDGLGDQGDLRIAVNDRPAATVPVRVGQPATTVLDLDAGWNRVELALAGGNFRPSDLQPGNGDRRLLSFAPASIDIVTE